MEKSYRDLFDALAEEGAAEPAVAELVAAVEAVDDLDPLRIPSIKAMKRSEPPPINLSYALVDESLTMYARNTVRKRKAPQPAVCAQIPAFPWLFDPSKPFPGDDTLRARCVELVHRSFGYLEVRIGNYFEVGHDGRLKVEKDPPALVIETEG